GVDMRSALAKAIELGYAEPDPSLDIEGDDAAHKIAILAALTFSDDLRGSDVVKTGITRIDSVDFEFACRNRQTIKLLASAHRRYDGAAELWVAPAFVPRTHILSHVRGVTNGLWVEAEPIGPTFYSGAGAGQGSTSSGILSDVMRIARAGDEETLSHLMPVQVSSQETMRHLTVQKFPERYLRLRGESAEAAAVSLGYPALGGGPGWIAVKAPAQTAAQREEMLGTLATRGIEAGGVCEIRYAFTN
ncbi:hypothetical protein HZA57_07795, partial [Candidatus Poribacteria bacterium]|nr:hypothetical protein [Candidatus Poribacteria bacterium]